MDWMDGRAMKGVSLMRELVRSRIGKQNLEGSEVLLIAAVDASLNLSCGKWLV